MTEAEYQSLPPLRSLEELFSLRGKVGLITGAAGGMGREFARTFAQAGARLALADLSLDRCQQVVDSLPPSAEGHFAAVADLSRKDSAFALVDEIESKFGRLDFIVHNVMAKPSNYYRDFSHYEEDTWNKVFAGNVNGAFFLAQRASSLLARSGGGSIVFTASIYGVVAPDQRIYEGLSAQSNPYGGEFRLNAPAAYSASKGALVSLAKHLASQLAPAGTRVNVLTPGGVYDRQDPAFHRAYVDRVPLGRMGTWTDYNGAALFLVSNASRYMTGANLIVDGGWTAW